MFRRFERLLSDFWADEFPTDTVCWSNKIFLIDLVDYPSGIIIEDTAIVQSFKMWFEFMWKKLP